MSALREAAQQALEALEGGADSWRLVDSAITALKAALAEPAQEPVAWVCYSNGEKHNLDFDDDEINALPVGTKLYTAPPQRKPLTEPVLEALKMAVRQNEHDMLMTGEELRQARAAIKAAEENT